MLILGCDIGSETHYVRAIDTRGRKLSKSAFGFSNTAEGFESMLDWSTKLATANDKKQIVLGLEPTDHYWFCLTNWLVAKEMSVVQVNPYAVKQTKEVEDNSQLKDDKKDPKLIANLVKDGNFGMQYLPEKLYADIRRLSMFRDQLNEDRIKNLNRLHREMKIYFPEYKDVFGKIDGEFSLGLLKAAPFPDELAAIIELWGLNVQTEVESKKLRPTDRPMTTPLFLLRCVQIGISIRDLDLLTIGLVNDMYAENGNDDYKGYKELATQEDFDRF